MIEFKFKIFMDVFNDLSGQGKNDVELKNFINELMKREDFSEEEAEEFFAKAWTYGKIYERRPGFFAKA